MYNRHQYRRSRRGLWLPSAPSLIGFAEDERGFVPGAGFMRGGGGGGGGTTYTENFDGTGNLEADADWSKHSGTGTLQQSSGSCTFTATGSLFANYKWTVSQTLTTNGKLRITMDVTSVPSSGSFDIYLALCVQGASGDVENNCYRAYFSSGNNCRLQVREANATTLEGNRDSAFSTAGGLTATTYAFEVEDNSGAGEHLLRAFKNGTQIGTDLVETTPVYTSGVAGWLPFGANAEGWDWNQLVYTDTP